MRILTWNIRHGGGARVPRILAGLDRHRLDIAVLTEYRHNSGGEAIRTGLRAMGLVCSEHDNRRTLAYAESSHR